MLQRAPSTSKFGMCNNKCKINKITNKYKRFLAAFSPNDTRPISIFLKQQLFPGKGWKVPRKLLVKREFKSVRPYCFKAIHSPSKQRKIQKNANLYLSFQIHHFSSSRAPC